MATPVHFGDVPLIIGTDTPALSLLCCCANIDDCCPSNEGIGVGGLYVHHDCDTSSPTSIPLRGGGNGWGPWIVSCAEEWRIFFHLICTGTGVCDFILVISADIITADPDCVDLDFELRLPPIAAKCAAADAGKAWFGGFTIPDCPTGTCCTVTDITIGTSSTTVDGDATTC